MAIHIFKKKSCASFKAVLVARSLSKTMTNVIAERLTYTKIKKKRL
jgi:hypothetical protein